jgi:tRNA(adenine34) deaminase
LTGGEGSNPTPSAMVEFEAPMRLALDEARRAFAHGDVPIGAVIVDADGEVLASAHNRKEETGDPTAHAEMLAIRATAEATGGWHLGGHTLIVTLEPCAMCAMAAVWARLDRIVYAAPDLKTGAAWSLFNIPQDGRLNHRCELVQGVLAQEAAALLEGFFGERR